MTNKARLNKMDEIWVQIQKLEEKKNPSSADLKKIDRLYQRYKELE